MYVITNMSGSFFIGYKGKSVKSLRYAKKFKAFSGACRTLVHIPKKIKRISDWKVIDISEANAGYFNKRRGGYKCM